MNSKLTTIEKFADQPFGASSSGGISGNVIGTMDSSINLSGPSSGFNSSFGLFNDNLSNAKGLDMEITGEVNQDVVMVNGKPVLRDPVSVESLYPGNINNMTINEHDFIQSLIDSHLYSTAEMQFIINFFNTTPAQTLGTTTPIGSGPENYADLVNTLYDHNTRLPTPLFSDTGYRTEQYFGPETGWLSVYHGSAFRIDESADNTDLYTALPTNPQQLGYTEVKSGGSDATTPPFDEIAKQAVSLTGEQTAIFSQKHADIFKGGDNEWGPDDDAKLLGLVGSKSDDELADIFGVSKSVIQQKKQNLNIKEGFNDTQTDDKYSIVSIIMLVLCLLAILILIYLFKSK